jgi:predicted RND superfamily exporter protein
VVDAVKTIGPAVVLDALAIALGFGIMILSQVPSNARLGGLVVLSVATCLSATLLLLPALLALWRPAVGPGR